MEIDKRLIMIVILYKRIRYYSNFAEEFFRFYIFFLLLSKGFLLYWGVGDYRVVVFSGFYLFREILILIILLV